MKYILVLILLFPSFALAGPMKMIGEKGKPSEVTRIITIKMHDNYLTRMKEKKDLKDNNILKS